MRPKICLGFIILLITALAASAWCAGLKSLPNGTAVHLHGRVVTTAFTGYFYIEDIDRTSGMRVNDTSAFVSQGDIVEISGVIGTQSGQKIIQVDSSDSTQFVNVLASGYPLPRPLGMVGKAVAAGSPGIDNTGMLVTVWGKATCDSFYAPSGDWCTYIDDGSNVSNDTTTAGLKVYDYNMHSKDEFVSLTGVAAMELPAGQTSSIPVVLNAYYTPTSPSTGNGTVNGSITADTAAAGKTVRIYGTCGSSTTCELNSQGIGSYSLSVPAGTYSFCADLAGYSRDTEMVTVNNGSTSTCDFTISQVGKVICAYAKPGRIAPNGISETTVTAVALDEEGRGLAGQSVTWSTDLGIFVNGKIRTVTDANGEAHITLRSASSTGTATVSAAFGTQTARAYVEFVTADAPSVIITKPASGNMVVGDAVISLSAQDTAGTNPGLAMVMVYVDGTMVSSFSGTPEDITWQSSKLANGEHTITAIAVDKDFYTGLSNIVKVNTTNSLSQVSVSPQSAAGNQAVTISAKITTSADWKVSIKDVYGTEVWNKTGTGTTISASWPGTSSGGLYMASVSDGTNSTSLPIAVNTDYNPSVLLVLTENGFPRAYDQINDIVRIVKNKGLSMLIMLPGSVTWENMYPILSSYNCQYFFIYCNGNWNMGTPEPVTHILLPNHKQVLYARRWDGAPKSGGSAPGYPCWTAVYAEDLGRGDNPLSLAWIQSSFSGRIGAKRDDLYSKYSSYELTAWNDMAASLGITPLASWSYPCGYVGWYGTCANTSAYVGDGSLPGITTRTWSTLSEGYTFEFARNWIDLNNEGRNYTQPKPDTSDPDSIKSTVIAPYYNWRFWGTTGNALF